MTLNFLPKKKPNDHDRWVAQVLDRFSSSCSWWAFEVHGLHVWNLKQLGRVSRPKKMKTSLNHVQWERHRISYELLYLSSLEESGESKKDSSFGTLMLHVSSAVKDLATCSWTNHKKMSEPKVKSLQLVSDDKIYHTVCRSKLQPRTSAKIIEQIISNFSSQL